MSAPICRVRAVTFDSEGGEPVVGATVVAQLSSYEVFVDGHVVPQRVEATTDMNGEAFLDLFPNQLGSVESFYAVTINAPNGKRLRTTAVVPNLPTADLHAIAELPPYDGRNDGQLYIDAAIRASEDAVIAKGQAEAAAADAGNSAASATASAASASTFAAAAAASASTASGSEANALSSQNAAAGSATNAGNSATAALGSQNAAAGSAATAADLASAALNSQNAAAGSATAAGNSATAAAGSASSASTSAGTATDQATAASTSAGAASTSAGAASTSATNAASSATAAAGSAAAAAAAADSVGLTGAAVNGAGNLIVTRGDLTTYDAGNVVGPQGPMGASITPKGQVADPSGLPPTGNTAGDAYVSLDTGHLWAWTGSAWTDIGQFQGPPGTTDYMALTNRPTLGTAAAMDVPGGPAAATAAQVVKGNDPRLTDARAPTAHTHAATDIGDSTSTGRAVLTAADAGAARTAIGAGTSSFSGSWTDLSNKPAVIAAGADQAAARSAIGAEPAIAAGDANQYRRGDKSWQALNKAAVGLSNVDNTSDADKPISTATQTALDSRAPKNSPSFGGAATSQTGFVWGGSSGFGLTATGYAVEEGLRANYIFDAGHGYTTQLTAYHNPGNAAFFQAKVGTNIFRLLDDGSAQKLGGGSWASVSDARAKDNIEDWTTGLGAVLALRVRQWTFKPETGRDPTVRHRGLVAQEAEIVAPTMVRAQKDSMGSIAFDDLRSVDPSDLPYILVNAVQALHAELVEAKARIAAVEASA